MDTPQAEIVRMQILLEGLFLSGNAPTAGALETATREWIIE